MLSKLGSRRSGLKLILTDEMILQVLMPLKEILAEPRLIYSHYIYGSKKMEKI